MPDMGLWIQQLQERVRKLTDEKVHYRREKQNPGINHT
jgi:hypothetical protein